MELSPTAEAFRRKILTDREVRQAARALKKMMGEAFGSASAQYGLSITDGLRFLAVSTHLIDARELKGLTLKTVAKQLRAPQYRIADIERWSTKRLDPHLLGRYVDAMEIRSWFSQWEAANKALAKRLAVPKAEQPNT